MKALWVALGVLVGIGVLCCGGRALIGTGIFDRTKRAAKSAETYAQESVAAVAGAWDINQLKQRAAPSYSNAASSKQAEEFFKAAKEKLGAMTSHPVFISKNPDPNSKAEDGTFTKYKFAGDAMFSKGQGAGITIVVVKTGEDWQIADFQVRSPVLSR